MQNATETTAAPRPRRALPARNARILLADDSKDARAALVRLLRGQRYDVIEASDAGSAMSAFRRYEPDLVLLDVRMPGGGGLDVCRTLKNDPRSALVPVVMLSGLDTVEDRVRGLEAGADDYFAKPAAPAEVLARVRGALRTKQLTDELEAAEAVLYTLARAVEGKDPGTRGHCERLSELAVMLGAKLGLPARDLGALRRAGIVHDIGKVSVPDRILLKPGPLDAGEWETMRRHPEEGVRIVAPLRSFQDVLPVVRHHHERFDGSGYPDGLRGEEIPVTARVLQVVDVYDALTSERSYKTALAPAAALDVMDSEVRRGWWDPTIFAAFRDLVRGGALSPAPATA
jgi:putative two-component system response regulator